MKNDLSRLLASLSNATNRGVDADADDRGGRGGNVLPSGDAAAHDTEALMAAYHCFSRELCFKVGDLVRWKRTEAGLSMSNRRRPGRDEMAVVVGFLDQPPIHPEQDIGAGSPLWRECLDLQLGLLDSDGDFEIYHFDSARFELVPPARARGQAARRLRELQSLLQAELTAFKPGMLVRWKPDLKNRTYPSYGVTCVVMEVLEHALMDPSAESGTPYFQEPLNLVLGMLHEDKFLVFHFDGRRFESVVDEAVED